MTESRSEVRVLNFDESCPELALVEGEGASHAVVWPGVGAQHRSMHRIDLPATGRTITLRHPMEAVYYIVRGAGAVLDVDAKAEQALVEGSMVHVEPDTAYRFLAGSTGMEVLGGPCPPDPALYRHLETT